jgi:transposase
MPRDFGYHSPLWTLDLTRAVLEDQRGARVHSNTIFRMLRRHGLQMHSAPTRAFE